MGNVASELVSPYYDGSVFSWWQLCWSLNVACRNGSLFCAFCGGVTYTVELLDQRQLVPEKILVHVPRYMLVSEAPREVVLC